MSAKRDQLLKQAVLLRDHGNLQASLKILQRLLKMYPEDKAVLLVAGVYFWDYGPLADAEQTFRVATRLFPESGLASTSLFLVLWNLERFDNAFEEAKRFLSEYDYDLYLDILNEIAEPGVEEKEVTLEESRKEEQSNVQGSE